MSTTAATSPTDGSTPGLNGITRYSDVKNATKTINDKMGKAEFLTLFTTQLRNQNPLDPVKNEAFVAQLAQFSQLEATTNMSTSLDGISKAIKADRFMNGANLIGKMVAAPKGSAQLVDGAAINGLISLPEGADKVTLNVYDASNKKVFSQEMGRQLAGDVNLRWDGYDNDGKKMADGIYKIVASVKSLGKTTDIPISTPTTVKSVSYSASNDDLIVELQDGSTVPLSQVSRIAAPLPSSPSAASASSGLNTSTGNLSTTVPPGATFPNLSSLFGN